MTITLSSSLSGVPIGGEVLIHKSFALRGTPLYVTDSATFLRSGFVSSGDSSLYPQAYLGFGWAGQYWNKVASAFGSVSMADVAYGLGKFFAISFNAMWTSTDGIIWSTVTPPSTNMRNILYAGGLLLVSSSDGIYSTSDGVTWTLRTSTNVTIMAYGNGRWIGRIVSSTTSYTTSTDGITWTTQTTLGGFSSIAYNTTSGLWLATASAGGGVYSTSSDGITWTTRSLPNGEANSSMGVSAGGGFFSIITGGASANSPKFFYRTADGINFSVIVTYTPSYPTVLSIFTDPKGTVFIGSQSGTSNSGIVSTFDGTSFVSRILPTVPSSEVFARFAASSDTIVCVSSTGNAYYSQAIVGLPVEDTVGSSIRYMRIK